MKILRHKHAVRRLTLITVLIAIVTPQAVQAQTPTAADTRPNILLLLSEDGGLELGCYGDALARTPNLDQLAEQGVRFTNAYVVQAGCSPSRAALLTGLFPHQNGQIGLATHRMRLYHGSTPNLPTLLHDQGYYTALIGKLHINPEERFAYDARVSVETFNKRNVQAVAKEAEAVFKNSGDRPFFLQISYADTHSPFVPKDSDGGLPVEKQDPDAVDTIPMIGYSTPAIRQTLANYYDCWSRLDTGVGLVLEALEASGKADNTLVVFMSDHGPEMVRGKMTCYEGGLRVPLIIRYPGQAESGSVRDELVSELDLAPTLLAAADVQRPDFWRGLSLMPLLRAPADNWRDRLFTEFTLHWPERYYPQRAVRDQRYKLIHNLLADQPNPVYGHYLQMNNKSIPTILAEDLPDLPADVLASLQRFADPPEYELYDLQADPWERHNLADDPEHQHTLKQLKRALEDWQVETDDPLRHDDVLERFTDEVASTFTGPDGGYEHVGRNTGFQWRYPRYFVASMREATCRVLGVGKETPGD